MDNFDLDKRPEEEKIKKYQEKDLEEHDKNRKKEKPNAW